MSTPTPIREMIPAPATMEEARTMLFVAIREAIGGPDAADGIYRLRVKQVSQRTIAFEDRHHRSILMKSVKRLEELEREMAAAVGQPVPVATAVEEEDTPATEADGWGLPTPPHDADATFATPRP